MAFRPQDIDTSAPPQGSAYTAQVRANFLATQESLQDLNAQIGDVETAVNGLGTMASQDADDVNITGGTATLSQVQAETSAGLALKSSSGTDVALLGAGPGTGATFYGGVNITGALGVTGVTTVSDGTLAAPGLNIGAAAGGFFKGGAAVGVLQPVVGMTLDGATSRGLQFGYITSASTSPVWMSGPIAPTATSNGIGVVILGGPAGATSGNSGPLTMSTQVPINGAGGSIFRSAASGVGTNRAGGSITDTAGNATGTANAGSIAGNAGDADAGLGGNVRFTAGDSTSLNGGEVSLTGGAALGAGNGGTVVIDGGAANSGTGGAFLFRGGNSTSGPGGSADLWTGTGTTTGVNLRNRTNGPVALWSGDITRWQMTLTNFGPVADNAYSLGTGSARPTELFAVSGTINTSDITLKDVVPDAFPDPLTMIAAINPIAYRWREGKKVQVGARQIGVEIVAGEEIPILEPVWESLAGQRVHLGFSAQNVRAALDDNAPLDGAEYAVWTMDNPDDPNSRQGLRPDQLVPILWAAVQSLAARVQALEAP